MKWNGMNVFCKQTVHRTQKTLNWWDCLDVPLIPLNNQPKTRITKQLREFTFQSPSSLYSKPLLQWRLRFASFLEPWTCKVYGPDEMKWNGMNEFCKQTVHRTQKTLNWWDCLDVPLIPLNNQPKTRITKQLREFTFQSPSSLYSKPLLQWRLGFASFLEPWICKVYEPDEMKWDECEITLKNKQRNNDLTWRKYGKTLSLVFDILLIITILFSTNVCNSRVFIGLASMIYEPLYHGQQI